MLLIPIVSPLISVFDHKSLVQIAVNGLQITFHQSVLLEAQPLVDLFGRSVACNNAQRDLLYSYHQKSVIRYPLDKFAGNTLPLVSRAHVHLHQFAPVAGAGARFANKAANAYALPTVVGPHYKVIRVVAGQTLLEIKLWLVALLLVPTAEAIRKLLQTGQP